VFWVISVYFNIRNTLAKSGTFLLGHSVYIDSVRSCSGSKVAKQCVVSLLIIDPNDGTEKNITFSIQHLKCEDYATVLY